MTKIDEIRRRWAGHGPWHVDGRGWLVDADGNDLAEFERDGDDEYWQGIVSACASAPEDVAHLLGEVERLKKFVARALDDAHDLGSTLERVPPAEAGRWVSAAKQHAMRLILTLRAHDEVKP